mmetsp:Transcript_23469/g.44583  ORF Transcript_23469/g.44583 Transcript_23469/m.44583 type:complete len:90 (+) Transcript_23469:80-349(+)
MAHLFMKKVGSKKILKQSLTWKIVRSSSSFVILCVFLSVVHGIEEKRKENQPAVQLSNQLSVQQPSNLIWLITALLCRNVIKSCIELCG